jgi:hypothetical protein
MTRINVIPPLELSDKHLVAEYRELPRLAKHAAQKFAKNPTFTPPGSYRLGKGHMDFFVDKGLWLANRQVSLVAEMRSRGFTVNFPEYDLAKHPDEWRKDWQPTMEAIMLNIDRIKQRLRAQS